MKSPLAPSPGRRMLMVRAHERAPERAQQELPVRDSALQDAAQAFVQASRLHQNADSWVQFKGALLGEFLSHVGATGNPQRPEDLQPFHLTTFLAKAQDRGNRPATLCRKGVIIRAWARWMVREGLVRKCPMAQATIPREPKEDLVLPPFADLEAVAEDAASPALRDLFLMALDSGLRRGELLALRWAEVDLETATVRVRCDAEWKPKSKRSRVVGVSNRAVAILQRRVDLGGMGPWQDEVGEPLYRPMSVSQAWRRLARRRGVLASLKDLRHAHATDLMERGAHIREVQSQLGHRSVTTTERYTHASVAVARRLAVLQTRKPAPSAGRLAFNMTRP